MKYLVHFLLLMCIFAVSANAQITSAASGNWNTAATWSTAAFPTATDNVVIAAGHTVTIDTATAACNNLMVNGAGEVKFRNTGLAAGITINGNLTINGNATAGANPGKFESGEVTVTTFTAHTLTLYGNLTVNAGVDSSGVIVLRMGTNSSTAAGVNVTFAGTSNSEIRLQKTDYSTAPRELFNAITINKTGGAKVVLASGNLFNTNNNNTGNAGLYLISGIIETGDNIWVSIIGANGGVTGGSATSYVNGNFGRAFSTTANSNRNWEVGDQFGYRPITLWIAGSFSTKHYMVVRCVSGNANPGGSTFTGGVIDKVSAARYYKLTYYIGGSTTSSASLSNFAPSYGTDDGVAVGNTDLTVAYSTNERASWTSMTSTHTTSLTAPPTVITPTALTSGYPALADGGSSMYVALGRLTGTTTNTLISPNVGVEENNSVPSEYALNQNYPNPFNPSTNFTYQIGKAGFVSVKIYDVLGREVATLVNEVKQAGSHPATWNAAGFGSGIYFCKMQTGSFTDTKKLILVK